MLPVPPRSWTEALTLALVEVEVALVDVLPVALLVTSPTGEILRA